MTYTCPACSPRSCSRCGVKDPSVTGYNIVESEQDNTYLCASCSRTLRRCDDCQSLSLSTHDAVSTELGTVRVCDYCADNRNLVRRCSHCSVRYNPNDVPERHQNTACPRCVDLETPCSVNAIHGVYSVFEPGCPQCILTDAWEAYSDPNHTGSRLDVFLRSEEARTWVAEKLRRIVLAANEAARVLLIPQECYDDRWKLEVETQDNADGRCYHRIGIKRGGAFARSIRLTDDFIFDGDGGGLTERVYSIIQQHAVENLDLPDERPTASSINFAMHYSIATLMAERERERGFESEAS